MDKDKLERFINVLNKKNEVSFYLYNVRYKIIRKNKSFIIKHSGSTRIYLCNELIDLFKECRVYGESLAETFENIILL